MGLLIMTNAQMGSPSLGRNGSFVVDYGQKQYPSCGIMYSRCSNLGVGLKRKSEKNSRIFLFRRLRCGTISAMSKEESDKQFVGGGVIEKEFEFKPSFSEYLKAMESVKTDQVRKRAHNSNRYTSEAGSWGKDESRTPSSGRDHENVKVRKFEGYPDEEKLSEAVEQKELQGNGNGVSQYEGVVRRQFDGRGNVIRKSKDKVNGNEGRMDAKVEWISRGEATGYRWLHYHNKVVEPELKDSYLDKDRKFRNSQDSSSALINDKKSGSNVNSRGKHFHDRGSSQMFQTKGKSYEKEGVCDRNCETHSGTRVINPIKIQKDTDEEFKRKHRKLIGGSKPFLEEGYDNSWELERAAFNTFEEGNDIMDKRRVSRMEMEERIQRLARRLNGADINVPEWMFSKMMRSAQIRYSDHSTLRVIQILGKLGNWRRVLQVIEWLQMRERFKSHRLRCVYTTALNVLGKAKRPVEALNVFHTMQQQMSSYPDLVAYHCITVTLGQSGYLKELFDVIDSMRSLPKKKFKTGTLERWDPRLEPDVVVYNAVLNACIRRKKWEGAFWVLQQLKQQGQKPSATTYGLVMEVMLACGKYNLVHEFFRKVQKSYIPNTLAYKVLVNTLWREGKTDEAVLAVEDMERQGIVGSAALYYDLARCLCSAGRCQEALMQIEKICKVANKPLVVTYTGLIQACLDSGNIRDASYVFNQMKNVCSPNLVTCNIMLKAFMEHDLFEEGMKLFKKMLEDSYHITREYDNKGLVIPDIYTFNTMLDACISEKRWDDLEWVYRRMLHHGFHFNAKRHVRMILDASKAGKVELLEITWKHLVEADRKPPPSLIKERFCNRLENEDYVTAISCLTSHPVSDSPEFSKSSWLKLFTENSQRFRENTLVQLIQEASSILTAINDSPNVLLLQNLIYSCTEFLRTCTSAPEMKLD